ncbi:MAG: hypothetical protein ETSY2_18115 [Candidatus Entotheonella gemina]|uniref:Uncharacterized protein n=1 Tax=Candidatus Entotheonella gemina TaxID=1429439 RepID=W4M7X6_9BACT|nr:MAG: hypothetical protein ETSY2_18115 [Candidatus Entotheonella gemina]
MATHRSLSDSTDEEFVKRMATTYPERFGEPLAASILADRAEEA